jgi:hypothetical protein
MDGCAGQEQLLTRSLARRQDLRTSQVIVADANFQRLGLNDVEDAVLQDARNTHGDLRAMLTWVLGLWFAV